MRKVMFVKYMRGLILFGTYSTGVAGSKTVVSSLFQKKARPKIHAGMLLRKNFCGDETECPAKAGRESNRKWVK